MAEHPTGKQKAKYISPVLCPLGELAKSKGQACNSGLDVVGASCKTGAAAKNCHVGSNDV